MGKVLIAIVFLLIGLVVGGVGGTLVGFGGGAGVGVATGLTAGACGVARAAEEEGLLSPGEASQALTRGLRNLAALNPEIDGETLTVDEEDCAGILRDLREGLSG